MYTKNLTEDLRLRLSSKDMDFLRKLSAQRGVSVSEVIRGIIGEYRRSLETMDILRNAINLAQSGEAVQYGDTKTDFNDIL